MLKAFSAFFLLIAISLSAQVSPEEGVEQPKRVSLAPRAADTSKVATIDMYRIISLERDTTYVDTSLTIQKEYQFNYLRRDIFGLMPFPNEGQPYNTLFFGLRQHSPFPEFGYSAKHFNYLQVGDIKYYSVATPLTELYYKSVMEQGQTLDAFITLNTSERFNFSIAYKGLRSLGKYVNQLTSAGNFRFTTSYNTLNKRYYVNFHFTGQDMLNGENGGITNIEDFGSDDPDYENRARLNVFFTDALTVLKGKRAFIDHHFRINRTSGNNNLYLMHQLNYEYKFFEFNQRNLVSTLDDGTQIVRFGSAFVTANINDQVRYNRMYNKVGAVYENSLLGKFTFFVEDFRYNYFYNKIIVMPDGPVQGLLSDEIYSVGGQYEYRKNKWRGTFLMSNSVSDQDMSNIDGKMSYTFNDRNSLSVQYQYVNKLPDLIYNLHQSSYVGYNWYNNFNNEKISTINIVANTQWLNASASISSFSDKLFFSDDVEGSTQIVTPKQFGETINYFSVKLAREFRYGKFALDNTVLYQQTEQGDNIINVPKIVARNTLYFSDYFFKRALYLQTGVTFNYFSKYYADDYNPVIAEFFVQDQRKIGDFPMLDFFINARIRQTRIFFKAEHFNSSFTGSNYYSAPNYPYRDFMIRFGIVWNFFK
jgi:hypothetical protein